jgi:hypothetical protein
MHCNTVTALRALIALSYLLEIIWVLTFQEDQGRHGAGREVWPAFVSQWIDLFQA